MNKDLKNVLMSILVGACVAFMTTLFQGLADFLKANAVEMASAASASFYHIAKHVRLS